MAARRGALTPQRAVADNLAALGVVCAHRGEERPRLTAVEREQLARWHGWGAAPQVFDKEEFAPDRVRLSEAAPGDTRPLRKLLPLLEAGGVRAVSPSGVLGDPAGAGADEGRALLREAAADLARTVAALRDGADGAGVTAATGSDETGEVRT